MSRKKICYSEVCNTHSLKRSLTLLKSNKTFRVNNFLEKHFTREKLELFFKCLKVQSYWPNLSKKVYIKNKKGIKHYLNIISMIDKVVQKRIIELLAPVMELLVYKQSFGFRFKRGSHDALKYVKSYWFNITWVIVVNIKQHFDAIHLKILLSKLYDYMDQPSVKLVSKICKVGCISVGLLKSSFQNFEQISEGVFIFPLLCNIYFYSLDIFILDYLTFICSTKSIQPICFKYWWKSCLNLNKAAFFHKYCAFKKSLGHKTYKKLLKARVCWTFKSHYNISQLLYVRYFTSFMLGLKNVKLQAINVFNAVISYLYYSLKLVLHANTSKIASSVKPVKYLGILINWNKYLKN